MYVYMDLMREFEIFKRVVKLDVGFDFKVIFIILYEIMNDFCKEIYDQGLKDVLKELILGDDIISVGGKLCIKVFYFKSLFGNIIEDIV